ncbi:hypothetical protein HPB47_002207, partial [Ixodes persulcatus]
FELDDIEWPVAGSYCCQVRAGPGKTGEARAAAAAAPARQLCAIWQNNHRHPPQPGSGIFPLPEGQWTPTDFRKLTLLARSGTHQEGRAWQVHPYLPESNPEETPAKKESAGGKLLTIGTIEQKGKALKMKPYVATSSAQTKEVIYLRGHDNDETPESLMKELECRTHQISAARIIGRSGRTVLITFESQTLPRYVRYACESFKVSSYRPRSLVCHKCHTLGHKADVCPQDAVRCGGCGHEHDPAVGCKLQPKCINCGGAHVATSNDCPLRKIPVGRQQQPGSRPQPRRDAEREFLNRQGSRGPGPQFEKSAAPPPLPLTSQFQFPALKPKHENTNAW